MKVIGEIVFARGGRGKWVTNHGFFMSIYILYGLGNYFVEDTISLWERDMLWLLAYGVAFVSCLVLSTWWAPKYQSKVQDIERRGADWQDDLQGVGERAAACFIGVTKVTVVILVAQLALLFVVHHLGGVILWPLSFAFLSSTVAGIGAYFYIGYPGMADLNAIDQSFGPHGSHAAGSLPAGLVQSLNAEMTMLRSLTGALVWLYPFAGMGSLFALEKISVLFGWGASNDVPVEGQVWFIIGVALLLVGTHATITGPVHGRYYEIARWLRWREGV